MMPFDVSRLQQARIELIAGRPVRPGQVLVDANITDRERCQLKYSSALQYQSDDLSSWRCASPPPSVAMAEALSNAGLQLWTGLTNNDVAQLSDDTSMPGIRYNTVYFGTEAWDFYHGGPMGVPVAAEKGRRLPSSNAEGRADLAILDTGLPRDWQQHPAGLEGVQEKAVIQNAIDALDENQDGLLDIQAGHGLFICGLVRQAEPSVGIDMYRVLNATGEGDEATIIATLECVLGTDVRVVSLSFGGFPASINDPEPPLAATIRKLTAAGKVIVAAAGNAGEDPEFRERTMFPASMPEVIAVGAFSSTNGKKTRWPSSNPGETYALGVGLVSTYVGWAHGRHEPAENAWAVWNGTSFAAPLVAAKRAAATHGGTTISGVTDPTWPPKTVWP